MAITSFRQALKWLCLVALKGMLLNHMGDAFLYLALTSGKIFVWNIISQLSFGFLSFIQLATNQAENDRCIVKLWTFEKWWKMTNWLWHWAFIGGVSALIEASSKAMLMIVNEHLIIPFDLKVSQLLCHRLFWFHRLIDFFINTLKL